MGRAAGAGRSLSPQHPLDCSSPSGSGANLSRLQRELSCTSPGEVHGGERSRGFAPIRAQGIAGAGLFGRWVCAGPVVAFLFFLPDRLADIYCQGDHWEGGALSLLNHGGIRSHLHQIAKN